MAGRFKDYITSSVSPLNVIDDDVLNVLKEIPRALFVPNQYKSFAHVDMKIPLGYGQYMLLPSVEAKILQSMSIKKSETVIVVGSGSGVELFSSSGNSSMSTSKKGSSEKESGL